NEERVGAAHRVAPIGERRREERTCGFLRQVESCACRSDDRLDGEGGPQRLGPQRFPEPPGRHTGTAQGAKDRSGGASGIAHQSSQRRYALTGRSPAGSSATGRASAPGGLLTTISASRSSSGRRRRRKAKRAAQALTTKRSPSAPDNRASPIATSVSSSSLDPRTATAP